MLTIAATGQTLNVKVGNVTYQFPANQTGEITYANGETLTIMGKTFTLADISSMTVDNSEVTDNQCTVSLAGVTLTNPSGAAINITNSSAFKSVRRRARRTRWPTAAAVHRRPVFIARDRYNCRATVRST